MLVSAFGRPKERPHRSHGPEIGRNAVLRASTERVVSILVGTRCREALCLSPPHINRPSIDRCGLFFPSLIQADHPPISKLLFLFFPFPTSALSF